MIDCRKPSRGQLLHLWVEERTKSLNVLNVLSPGYYFDTENVTDWKSRQDANDVCVKWEETKPEKETRTAKVFSFNMLILIEIAIYIVTSCFSLNTGKIKFRRKQLLPYTQMSLDDLSNEHQILGGFSLITQFYFKSAETVRNQVVLLVDFVVNHP